MHMFKYKQPRPREPKSNIKRQSDFQTMIITFNMFFPQFKHKKMEQDSCNLLARRREETIVWI